MEMPSYVYLVNSFCLFWYMTLDAIDGKHARATNSSSPLGELFDHGCDAISSMLQTVVIISSVQFGGTIYGAALITLVNFTFFFAIWEQYYTGIMRFSAMAGPTEALLMAISIQMTSFFFRKFILVN